MAESPTSPSRQTAVAPAAGYAIERVAPRTPGTLVPNIQAIRLMPLDVEASLVNISTRGMLILCSKRLGAGMVVRAIFYGNGSPTTVGGKVVRSLVSNVGARGELWYHVGIEFDNPIDLELPLTVADEHIVDAGGQRDAAPITPTFVNRW